MVKGVDMLGIECEFMANFAIPDYLGLGKSVSRGFGAVAGMRGDSTDPITRRRSEV